MAYVAEISKKLPDLENELRNMRAVIAKEEATIAAQKLPQQKPSVSQPQQLANNIPQSSYPQQSTEAPRKV